MSAAETETENQTKDWNIVKTFQSTPGIEPRTSISAGKHSTPTPPQLPLKTIIKMIWNQPTAFDPSSIDNFFPALTDQQLVEAALPEFLPAEDRDADDVADDADDAHHAVGVPGKAWKATNEGIDSE